MTILNVCAFGTLMLLVAMPPTAVAAGFVDCDQPRAHDRNDDGPGRLQRAIDRAKRGDTIHVRGTCDENVTIPLGKDSITLDGGGAATITGPDGATPTVLVRAKDVKVRGFTVTGGLGGIAMTQVRRRDRHRRQSERHHGEPCARDSCVPRLLRSNRGK